MAHRNKNLLEAFSASAASEKAEQGAAQNGAPPQAGGPFATPPVQESILTPAERELVKEASSGPPAFARAFMRPENYQGLIAVVVILMALSFLIGRATSGSVTAAEESTVAAPEESEVPVLAAAPIPVPGSTEPVRERSSAEADLTEATDDPRIAKLQARLADTRNEYTVVMVQYRRDRDEELANAAFYYLLDQGLPVVMLYKGSSLYIVLGAAPEQVDLDDLLARAKVLRGPPPGNRKGEFSTAYLQKIDNLVPRD